MAIQLGVQDGCARPVAGDSSPALSPQGMRFRISPESASTRPSALFGDPQDCCLGHTSANQPSRSQLEDGAGWGAPKPQHSPSRGWCCSLDGVPPKRRRGCSRVWNLGHGRGWEVGHPWGADADPTMHPHPSLQQTFFFNVFEAPAELFDMPIFITVSAA